MANNKGYLKNASGDTLYPNALQLYSTTEQVIGTWINGKAIYRKVIQCGDFVKNATTVTTQTGITNIDQVIDSYGIGLYANGIWLPMTFMNADGWNSYHLSGNASSIIMQCNGIYTPVTKIIVIIEYTKTV